MELVSTNIRLRHFTVENALARKDILAYVQQVHVQANVYMCCTVCNSNLPRYSVSLHSCSGEAVAMIVVAKVIRRHSLIGFWIIIVVSQSECLWLWWKTNHGPRIQESVVVKTRIAPGPVFIFLCCCPFNSLYQIPICGSPLYRVN